MVQERAEHRLWVATRRLALALLLVWLSISLAAPWFARSLNEHAVMGFPAGYWLAAQGALLAFLAIIVVCIRQMERLEDRYQAEAAAEAASDPPAP